MPPRNSRLTRFCASALTCSLRPHSDALDGKNARWRRITASTRGACVPRTVASGGWTPSRTEFV